VFIKCALADLSVQYINPLGFIEMNGKLQLIKQELLKCETELFGLRGESGRKWLGDPFTDTKLSWDIISRIFNMDNLKTNFEKSTLLTGDTRTAFVDTFVKNTEISLKEEGKTIEIKFNKSNTKPETLKFRSVSGFAVTLNGEKVNVISMINVCSKLEIILPTSVSFGKNCFHYNSEQKYAIAEELIRNILDIH
jgi:hypothetical protein